MTSNFVDEHEVGTDSFQYQDRSGAFVLTTFEFRALFVKRPLQSPEMTIVCFIFIRIVVPQHNSPQFASCLYVVQVARGLTSAI